MELLVCCVFAYWLMKHLPEIAVDAAQGIGYGLRGEESPAAQARRQRLQDAGVDPAAGGAFRQYAGNLANDFWLDRDRARAKRRQGQDADDTIDDQVSRWRQRLDDELDRRAESWRRRQSGDNPARPQPGPPPATGPGSLPKPGGQPGPRPPAPDPATPAPAREPIKVDATVGDPPRRDKPAPPPNIESTPGPGPSTTGSPDPPPRPTPPQTPPPPIRVNATVGEPDTTATPAQIEGDPMSATVATRGIPVTGVQSGAAECLSIHRQLEAAVAAFQAELYAVAGRVNSMGEQTLTIVQFAGASGVVLRMAQAGEATAAARASAAACAAEVGPLLMQTRTEFLRRA